jgi:hypothetical protein
VLAEACEIAGTGATGVDRGGDARAAAKLLGIDAERGAAPIDMGVQIDEARRDDMAGHLAHIRARIRPQLASDRSYLATGKGDVGYGIESL